MAQTTRSAIINSHVKNYSTLVDQRIRSQGELVVITYPTEFDENLYGERTTTDTRVFETGLIFDWDEYFTLLSHTDRYSERDTPSECDVCFRRFYPSRIYH